MDDDVPIDILYEIFLKVPAESLMELGNTNQKFKNIVHSEKFIRSYIFNNRNTNWDTVLIAWFTSVDGYEEFDQWLPIILEKWVPSEKVLLEAVESDDPKILKQVLHVVNARWYQKTLIRTAVDSRALQSLAVLFDHPNINPNRTFCLRDCIESNNMLVLDWLLKDGRIDPIDFETENDIMHSAIEEGTVRPDIIRRLYEDLRMIRSNIGLWRAIREDNEEFVRLLIESHNPSEFFEECCEDGKENMVDIFLTDKIVYNNYQLLRAGYLKAKDAGHKSICTAILTVVKRNFIFVPNG